MNAFEKEKDQFAEKYHHADIHVKQLQEINDEQSKQIANFNYHENERERQMILTMKENANLKEEIELLDQEMRKQETTTLFGMQQTIDEHEKKIAELETEIESRKIGGELDTKEHRDEKFRMNGQIELLMDR